ncbi:MAG: hypothetical protein MZV64_31680 [Ignavibacteriales bacterium]|nr:hypothetical protein [Ignavibacteriales bacterium]
MVGLIFGKSGPSHGGGSGRPFKPRPPGSRGGGSGKPVSRPSVIRRIRNVVGMQAAPGRGRRCSPEHLSGPPVGSWPLLCLRVLPLSVLPRCCRFRL